MNLQLVPISISCFALSHDLVRSASRSCGCGAPFLATLLVATCLHVFYHFKKNPFYKTHRSILSDWFVFVEFLGRIQSWNLPQNFGSFQRFRFSPKERFLVACFGCPILSSHQMPGCSDAWGNSSSRHKSSTCLFAK